MDESRKKSLEFLLTRALYSMQRSAQFSNVANESIKTLKIEELPDSWIVSLKIGDEIRSKQVSKTHFIFYPLKSKEYYPVDPVELNIESANRVIHELFAESLSKTNDNVTMNPKKSYFFGFKFIQIFLLFGIYFDYKILIPFYIVILLLLLSSIYKHISVSHIRHPMVPVLVLAFSSISGYKFGVNLNLIVAISLTSIYIISDWLPTLRHKLFGINTWVLTFFFSALVSSSILLLQGPISIISPLNFQVRILLLSFPFFFLLNSSVLNLATEKVLVTLLPLILVFALFLSIVHQPSLLSLIPFAVILSYFNTFFGESKNLVRTFIPFAVLNV